MADKLAVFVFLEQGFVPAGLLKFEGAGRDAYSVFHYGKKYLEREDALCLDPVQLPLEDKDIQTPADFQIFNGIRDAGPDKWGRYLLEKKFKTPLNELDYIAAASPDRVGALAFGESPLEPPKMLTPEGFVDASQVRRLDLRAAIEGVDEVLKNENEEKFRKLLKYGPSIGGARPKTTVEWDGKLYIAKFSTSLDTRNEALIEYATMSLAKECGLRTPEIDKTQVLGRDVYLIQRFDRIQKEESNFIPTHFISGLTATGFHESDHSSWSYRALAEAITRFSSDPESDKTELFQRLVFNILVFNNDDHLRNHGFIHAGGNNWDLSPLYDVVPTTINGETYALSLGIGDEGKSASIENALSACAHFGLEKNKALRLIKPMHEKVREWESFFKKCGVPDQDISKLKNSFRTLILPKA